MAKVMVSNPNTAVSEIVMVSILGLRRCAIKFCRGTELFAYKRVTCTCSSKPLSKDPPLPLPLPPSGTYSVTTCLVVSEEEEDYVAVTCEGLDVELEPLEVVVEGVQVAR